MEQQKSLSFTSSTILGRDEQAKLQQLLAGIVNANDSLVFRQPVDWKAYNLLDYPTIITKPMDLGTVKKKLATRNYENVQDCLEDIMQIWDNAKTYNPKQHQIHKLADKFEKQTRKMIKNYLPFVKFEAQAAKKKMTKKQAKAPVKNIPKTNQPKTYLQKQQEQKNEQNQQKNPEQEQPPQVVERKNFLYLLQLCSNYQIGVIFLLTKGNCPESIEFDEQGGASISAQKLNDSLLKRLLNLMDMWGISMKNVAVSSVGNKKK